MLTTGESIFSADPGQGQVEAVVYPWEISLAQEHQPDSAQNVIRGEIRSIAHVGNRARVRVGPVTAEVTEASVEKLGLRSAGRRRRRSRRPARASFRAAEACPYGRISAIPGTSSGSR